MLFSAPIKLFTIADSCLCWLSLGALLLWKLLINAYIFPALETFSLSSLGDLISKPSYFQALWKSFLGPIDHIGKRNKGFQGLVLNGLNFFLVNCSEICFANWPKDMLNDNIASF